MGDFNLGRVVIHDRNTNNRFDPSGGDTIEVDGHAYDPTNAQDQEALRDAINTTNPAQLTDLRAVADYYQVTQDAQSFIPSGAWILILGFKERAETLARRAGIFSPDIATHFGALGTQARARLDVWPRTYPVASQEALGVVNLSLENAQRIVDDNDYHGVQRLIEGANSLPLKMPCK